MEYRKHSNNPKNSQKRKKYGMKNRGNKQKTNNKMVVVSPNLSINTLNINGLNIPNKSQRWPKQIKHPNMTQLYDV